MQYQTACELAHRFPTDLANFIEIETVIRRGRFREETLTDLFLVAMATLPGAPLELIVPSEPKTGSDLDIVLVDLFSGKRVGYRIQAKRLSLGAKNWDRNAYKELAHKESKGTQYITLIDSARNEDLAPLYAFYNPMSICRASGYAVRGIELAPAGYVGHAIADVVAKKGSGKSAARQLRNLRAGFFPLTDLFCPADNTEGRGIATPVESASRVEASILRRILSTGRASAPDFESATVLPKVQTIPQAELARLRHLRMREGPQRVELVQDADIKRPRMILDATTPSKLSQID